jgi:hypothetical protein
MSYKRLFPGITSERYIRLHQLRGVCYIWRVYPYPGNTGYGSYNNTRVIRTSDCTDFRYVNSVGYIYIYSRYLSLLLWYIEYNLGNNIKHDQSVYYYTVTFFLEEDQPTTRNTIRKNV